LLQPPPPTPFPYTTLFRSLPVRLLKTHSHGYKAGPFIAILTSDGNRTFRGNRKNFIDLICTGRKMGVTIFVLTPGGIQPGKPTRSEEHTSELQSRENLVCR